MNRIAVKKSFEVVPLLGYPAVQISGVYHCLSTVTTPYQMRDRSLFQDESPKTYQMTYRAPPNGLASEINGRNS